MDKPTGERISSVNYKKIIAEDALERAQFPRSVRITPPFTSLTASRDAATIRAVIETRYGFTPTLDYCRDLVVFVEALTDGQ